MNLKSVKKRFGFLAGTPLHPQWLAGSGRKNLIARLNAVGLGEIVLDIGCYDKWPKTHLNSNSKYIGLDYLKTAQDWYGTRPDVYADGSILPVRDEAIDIVLLFDVCEHVAQTDRLFREISRILKPGGRLLMQIPFLYPLHDEPRDYIRLTRHGLAKLARDYKMDIEVLTAIGHPCETAALLSNLAISKIILNWLSNRSMLGIFAIFLPFIILKNNLLARSIGRLSRCDEFMPFAYQAVLRRII